MDSNLPTALFSANSTSNVEESNEEKLAAVANAVGGAQWEPQDLECLAHCPSCGALQSTIVLHENLRDHIFFAKGSSWRLVLCKHCTGAFLNPRPTPQAIGRAYANYYTHDAQGSGTKQPTIGSWVRRALANGYRNQIYATTLSPSLGFVGPAVARFSRTFRNAIQNEAPGLFDVRPSKMGESLILDVGCGSGLLLARARDAGWRVMGIEPDDSAAAAAASRGVEIVASRLEDLPSSFNATFERITLSHVIEHVHEPLAMLQRCKELLHPKGGLWLETPNIGSAGHDEFGADWRGLEPPRHLVLFSARAITDLLRKAGFAVVEFSAPRDVWSYMCEKSELIRQRRQDSTIGSSSPTVHQQPNGQQTPEHRAAEIRRLVADQPHKSEFLTLTARC